MVRIKDKQNAKGLSIICSIKTCRKGGTKLKLRQKKRKKFFLYITKSNKKLSKKDGAEKIKSMHEAETGPILQDQQEKVS